MVKGAGLDLITPTSIANSGGSASLSGGSVTATSVNSISLNGVFTSTYSNYRVTVEAVGATADALRIRFRDGTGDDSTSNYGWGGGYIAYGSSLTAEGGGSQSFGQISGIATTVGAFAFDCFLPQQAFNTTFASLGASPGYGRLYVGQFATTKVFTGFTLYPATTTLSGTIRVYGYRNS